ncbi:MAG: hypothetical protein EA426_18450 [Spirochaetaceae bacterium]|nr:MAG: hypothetical protein EA426_18450 [Spirochaetaceae bacterium]
MKKTILIAGFIGTIIVSATVVIGLSYLTTACSADSGESGPALTEFGFIGGPITLFDREQRTITGTLAAPVDTRDKMVAVYSVVGTHLELDGVEQISGLTANDFTSPRVYLVHGDDGRTAEYTVTVGYLFAERDDDAPPGAGHGPGGGDPSDPNGDPVDDPDADSVVCDAALSVELAGYLAAGETVAASASSEARYTWLRSDTDDGAEPVAIAETAEYLLTPDDVGRYVALLATAAGGPDPRCDDIEVFRGFLGPVADGLNLVENPTFAHGAIEPWERENSTILLELTDMDPYVGEFSATATYHGTSLAARRVMSNVFDATGGVLWSVAARTPDPDALGLFGITIYTYRADGSYNFAYAVSNEIPGTDWTVYSGYRALSANVASARLQIRFARAAADGPHPVIEFDAGRVITTALTGP